MITAILVQNTRWENVARTVKAMGEFLPETDCHRAQVRAVNALHTLTPAG